MSETGLTAGPAGAPAATAGPDVPGASVGGAAPREIAPGVHYLTVGKGVMRANVFFVRVAAEGVPVERTAFESDAERGGPDWVLIDAGSLGCAPAIREAAESLFGVGVPPASILLTHNHPDHSGALRDLVGTWGCPAWVHPADAPVVQEDLLRFHEWANPLDRWVVLPYMRLMGTKRARTMVERASLKGVVDAFDPGAPPAGLAGWDAVPTPGHTPGHVAYFRRAGRVLITGDAVLTMDAETPWGFLSKKHRLFGPPWYVTVDRKLARQSIVRLAELEPLVVAGGHGIPLAGPDVPAILHALAAGS